MKEFGGRAFARAAGRDQALPGEDFGDGEAFAAGVGDDELLEDPFLKCDRTVPSLALQVGDLLLQFGVRRGGICKAGQPLLQSRDLPGQRDDPGLLLLEMPFRVQQVVDGRDEALDPVAAAGKARKGVEEVNGREIPGRGRG